MLSDQNLNMAAVTIFDFEKTVTIPLMVDESPPNLAKMMRLRLGTNGS